VDDSWRLLAGREDEAAVWDGVVVGYSRGRSVVST